MHSIGALLLGAIAVVVGCTGAGEAESGQVPVPFAADMTMCDLGDSPSMITPLNSFSPSGFNAIDAARNFSRDAAETDIGGIHWRESGSQSDANKVVVVGGRGGPILFAVLVVDLGLGKWAVEQWAGCEEP